MQEQHAIDGAVLIYLALDDGKWTVDFPTIDGAQLDTPDAGALVNERCECGDAIACERARQEADLIPRPNGIELTDMLVDAVRRQEAAQRDSEEWRSAPGFTGLYEVSDRGRVRSWHRKGHVLKPMNRMAGHVHWVVLCSGNPSSSRVERERRHRIDVLVLRAFVRDPFDDEQPKHIDGDMTNNRLENLKWERRVP